MAKIKKIYEMDASEIDDYITTYLPVKTMEKNKYAEVFTDPLLINKMLDLFPKTVWTNPHLKWLDPATGAGFFMILVYGRLMKGLTEWEPNLTKRSQHIIGSMLFMVEINKTNCALCKAIFGPHCNLICRDFLSDFSFAKMEIKIKIKTSDNKPTNLLFDCIVGNPPFHDDFGLSQSGKRINGGKSKLYERIFLKSFKMLKPNGCLSFIVPDNIFSGNGVESYRVLQKNDVGFVSFNPSNQLFFPGIQQNVCYFIVCKKEEREEREEKEGKEEIKEKETTIETNDTNKFVVVLEDRPINPIRNWTLKTEKMINKFVSNKRNNVIYNRGQSLASYKGNKYPIIYTPFKTLYTNNLSLATGLTQKKAILFSMSTDLEFKMDYKGNVGAGPNTFVIPFNTVSEGLRLEKFLKSEEYRTLATATKTSRQYLKIAFIEHLQLTKIMGLKSRSNRSNSRSMSKNITKKRPHNTKSKTYKNKHMHK